jgi:hypothetical protein
LIEGGRENENVDKMWRRRGAQGKETETGTTFIRIIK